MNTAKILKQFEQPAGKVICACLQVTESAIRQEIRQNNLNCLEQVRACTGAGAGCTACHADLKKLIKKTMAYLPSSPLPSCSAK